MNLVEYCLFTYFSRYPICIGYIEGLYLKIICYWTSIQNESNDIKMYAITLGGECMKIYIPIILKKYIPLLVFSTTSKKQVRRLRK